MIEPTARSPNRMVQIMLPHTSGAIAPILLPSKSGFRAEILTRGAPFAI